MSDFLPTEAESEAKIGPLVYRRGFGLLELVKEINDNRSGSEGLTVQVLVGATLSQFALAIQRHAPNVVYAGSYVIAGGSPLANRESAEGLLRYGPTTSAEPQGHRSHNIAKARHHFALTEQGYEYIRAAGLGDVVRVEARRALVQ